jgi:hypothetical protein
MVTYAVRVSLDFDMCGYCVRDKFHCRFYFYKISSFRPLKPALQHLSGYSNRNFRIGCIIRSFVALSIGVEPDENDLMKTEKIFFNFIGDFLKEILEVFSLLIIEYSILSELGSLSKVNNFHGTQRKASSSSTPS